MVRVVFLHPDLGIGGAERLVVDAGLALQSRGHEVDFVTAHHDDAHCFSETRQDVERPRLRVTTAGDFLPRHVLGRCYALCAYLRMLYAALYLVLASGLRPQVIFCDQISAAIPLLKLFSAAKVVFYCHFPDQLLTDRKSVLKRLYRAPIDWVEERTTGMADVCLVNSKFTAGVFQKTFRSLRVKPEVLYPSLNTEDFDEHRKDAPPSAAAEPDDITFLSINRYERKKNLPLLLNAFADLCRRRPDLSDRLRLTVAGGYDTRVTENVDHHKELTSLAVELDIASRVTFLRSIPYEEKVSLLVSSTALLYSPSGEHFGIVPVEAMHCGLPVVAVGDGGPTETVVDGETGYLCEASAESFSHAMQSIIRGDGGAKAKRLMGAAGRKRVAKHFSFEAFTIKMHTVVTHLAARRKSKGHKID